MKFLRNILMVLCLCCISCGNSSATSDENMTKEQIHKMIDEVIDKKNKSIHDSVNVILKQQKESISKTKQSQNNWIIYSWLTVLSAMIIWLIYCWNKTAEKKNLDFLRGQITDIKNQIDSIKNIMKKTDSTNHQKNVNSQIQQISNRLEALEKSKKVDLPKKISVTIPPHSNPYAKDSKDKNCIKKGYFGNVKGNGIFNDVYDSIQDEVKFRVDFYESGEKAEYDLIDLKRIKSFYGIEKAILIDNEYELSLQDASDYETIEKGLVIKKENFWEIERKVKIRLKK